MINDPYIAAALIGFVFGVFVGVNVAYIVFRYSRMRKLMDEGDEDDNAVKRIKIGRFALVTISDGCIEIVGRSGSRLLLFFPPAFSYICKRALIDFNVTKRLRVSVWRRDQ